MATDANELTLPGQTTEQDREVANYVRMLASIEQCGLHYRGMCDILMKHGRFWTVQPYPRHLKTLQLKRCFENAFQMAYRHGFRYVEGLALGVIPVHHAWNVDDEDRVIDPTWARLTRRVRRVGELSGIGTSYFGISFDLEIVKKHRIIRDGMMVGSVLNNHANGFAIYRRPLPNDMINSHARKEVMEHGKETERRQADGRSARKVPREEPIASDSGVSHRRRTGGA